VRGRGRQSPTRRWLDGQATPQPGRPGERSDPRPGGGGTGRHGRRPGRPADETRTETWTGTPPDRPPDRPGRATNHRDGRTNPNYFRARGSEFENLLFG
jgi:hypothetical protein